MKTVNILHLGKYETGEWQGSIIQGLPILYTTERVTHTKYDPTHIHTSQ